MIWIRADANKEIGTGHVMRCLSIASRMRQQGAEVKFLLADDSAALLLQDGRQEYEVLHTAYDRMEEELPLLQKLAARQKPSLCLIDSYFVTPRYLEQMGCLCKTAYLDDVFRFSYPVDVLINYNVYGDLLPYRENPGKESTEFLLGTAYVPLRQEFCIKRTTAVREIPQNVLITTGGSDKYNLAGQILEKVLACSRLPDLQYHVVSGAFNIHLKELQRLAKQHPQVHIHQNVTRMRELMENCDIAVTAGGSTMYELCATGIPIICFSFVDNQQRIVDTFAEKGLVCHAGDYGRDRDGLPENIVCHLCRLAKNAGMREVYARRGQELVDGRGAERIACILCGEGPDNKAGKENGR